MELVAWASLFLVLFQACFAGQPHLFPNAIPPHLHKTKPTQFGSRGDGLAYMRANVAELSNDSMDVTVTWSNVSKYTLSNYDWIGVFDESPGGLFKSPVKFKYVFRQGAKAEDHGSIQFTLQNFRSSYVFVYIDGNQQFPQIVARSQVVKFPNVDKPMAHHLALSPSERDTMLVMWNQRKPANPTLRWGLSADKLEHSVKAGNDTYAKNDFCDVRVSPAGRQGWFEPGQFLTAKMPVTPGTTYFYSCGDSEAGWSDVVNFTAPPSASVGSTKLIVLADLGNAPVDGSMQHSFDFHNHGELPSRNTTGLAKRLMDNKDANAVVHVGDIAYGVGYLAEWDLFMKQIEPVASKIPWMASIGNHEMGWSGSDFTANGMLRTTSDSGGECGVAFLKRFPYAMQPLQPGKKARQADPWYSFDIGPVHFTMLSSEHDFTTNSTQWLWMVNDLKNVDRKVTPWLAVTSHRPMYIVSDYDGDLNVAQLLQEHLEAPLLHYGVDFFFAGHHHSYQRFCKIQKGQCVDANQGNANGIYHFVLGMAGYDHTQIANVSSPTAKFKDDSHWGVTFWEFTQTSAKMQFIDGATDEAIDDFSVTKATTEHQPSLVI